MEHNIPEIRTSRKVHDIALLSIVFLLALFSFGLGRLSNTTHENSAVVLCTSNHAEILGTTTTANTYADMKYIASKNGTVYHFPWCSGAKRIHKENLISFATKEEAEAAGYRPAANCKGL